MRNAEQQMMYESKIEFAHAGLNGGLGFGGAFAVMSLNEWMGFFVGVLTAIYMLFQIEAAWRKRRIALRKEMEFLEEKAKRDVQETEGLPDKDA